MLVIRGRGGRSGDGQGVNDFSLRPGDVTVMALGPLGPQGGLYSVKGKVLHSIINAQFPPGLVSGSVHSLLSALAASPRPGRALVAAPMFALLSLRSRCSYEGLSCGELSGQLTGSERWV